MASKSCYEVSCTEACLEMRLPERYRHYSLTSKENFDLFLRRYAINCAFEYLVAMMTSFRDTRGPVAVEDDESRCLSKEQSNVWYNATLVASWIASNYQVVILSSLSIFGSVPCELTCRRKMKPPGLCPS